MSEGPRLPGAALLTLALAFAFAVAPTARATEPAAAADATASPDESPTLPQPVAPEDRAALAKLGATLPAHGVLAPKTPAPSADDDAWRAYAGALLAVFAPTSLGEPARARLLRDVRPLAPAIGALVPRHRRYRALQAALALAVAREQAPHPLIGSPPYELRVGVTAPEVATLRDRLLLEGYGDASVTGRLRAYFDHRLKRALWRWQQDHGLPVTVVLDPLTRRRLDEPVPSEVSALAVALRRWRRLDLREDRGRQIIVHLNDYRLVAEEDGREQLAMKVIIGRPTAADATPMQMSAPLDAVVVNPDWRIPRRIVEESMRPRAGGDPAVLEAEGYEVKVGADGAWSVRQPPGPDNALGVLKFRLRGTDGIYLHDTSAPRLFKKKERALSHGCVRLERPRELAAWLLPERRGDVAGELVGGPTERIAVEPQVAVHFLYATTTVDAAGRVEHFPDVYGADAAEPPVDVPALAEALTR